MTSNKYLHHLEKVCSDYCMSASPVYNIPISRDNSTFLLSLETIKYKVLKDIPSDILKNLFTLEELKSIFSDTNLKKVKNL